MLNIGITGGIGSGKSTVCKIFESIGIPVYYADDRSKFLMANNTEVIEKVKALLGDDVYTDGRPNRKKIAEIVFNNNEKLKALNAIMHPAVREDSTKWQAKMKKKGHPYVLREAALVYETEMDKTLDTVIVVDAPKAIRIKRVMERDGVSENEVKARMDKQMPQSEKNKRADYLIKNDGKTELIPQVRNLHQEFLKLAESK